MNTATRRTSPRTPDDAARHYRDDDLKPSAGIVLDLARFVVNGDTLSADASDFGPFRNGSPWVRRMFHDACDLGLFIRSPRTGNVVRFVGGGCQRDDEGEIIGHVYVLYDRDAAYAGPIRHVLIFND